MKNLYILLLFAIIFGFAVANKASGQSCDKCAPNSVCIPLTFDIAGCEDVRITLCVRCGVTNPTIYWRGVTFENICPDYEAQIKQYLDGWIRDNTLQICGDRPCHEPPPFQVYFYKPLCGDVFWDGQRYHIYDAGANCSNECLDEREWCWCNCVPGECWDEECVRRNGAPYFRYSHLSYSETNPTACETVPYGDCAPEGSSWRFTSQQPWTELLRCVRILWDLYNCDSDCQD